MLGRWDVGMFSLLKLAQIVHDAVHLPGREGALAACVAELLKFFLERLADINPML